MSRFSKISTAVISMILACCIATAVALRSGKITFNNEECTTEVMTEAEMITFD